MSALVPSYVEKFNWAQNHFDSVFADVAALLKPKPYAPRAEANDDATEYSVYLDFTVPLRTTQWSLAFGDGVHALRCALDHSVYAIGVQESGQDPPPDWDRLEFPITETTARWNGARWKLKTLSTHAQAAIEGLQPHGTADEFALTPLGGLQEFDNADKHRRLHVVLCIPVAGSVPITGLIPGQRCTVTWHLGPIKPEAPFVTLTLDRPTPNVKVDADLTIEPCIPYIRRDGSETSLVLRPCVDAMNKAVQNVITTLAPLT